MSSKPTAPTTASIVVAAALAGVLTTGCFVSPRVAHNIGAVASAALWTAAIAGTILVLTIHDDHYHNEHCGHYRRWHDERWVYYYGGSWEYYEDSDATWYVYTE